MAINNAEMLIFPDSKNREVEFVKKHIKITVAVLISIIFASTGFAFSKVPPEKSSKENLVTEKVPAPQAPGTSENTATLKKIMTEPKISGFVGTATLIEENLMQVKDKKEVVTFDTSNPVLKVYKGLSDVVVGDTVAVEYTKDGIKITKLRGTTKAKALVKKKTEMETKSPRKTVVTRVTCTGKGPCAVSVDKKAD